MGTGGFVRSQDVATRRMVVMARTLAEGLAGGLADNYDGLLCTTTVWGPARAVTVGPPSKPELEVGGMPGGRWEKCRCGLPVLSILFLLAHA